MSLQGSRLEIWRHRPVRGRREAAGTGPVFLYICIIDTRVRGKGIL